MSQSNHHRCPLWTILLSLLLLGIVATIVTGGARQYYFYKKTSQPDLGFNLNILHFFTKEYLKRQYLRYWVEPLPTDTGIHEFKIFADEQSLDALNSDLPASGKIRFVPGHIQLNDPELSSEIQFRYRGGLPLHWLYKKKSLRVKLPPYTTYRGERQFNLVNPSTIHTLTDWVSYDMARDIGLLTPEYFPARLFINGQSNGLHYFLSRVDESLLRKNRRMPGSIYSGDTIYIPNPFGANRPGMTEGIFKDQDDQSLMWKDERLWNKQAARNAESKHNRDDIKKFIEIINQDDPLLFMRDFNRYFDKDKFYKFIGLDTITGSYHHDNFHNHKIYFDPYKGKFEPIAWDLRFWSSNFKAKDIPLYPLLRQIKLNPVLDFERDRVTYNLMQAFSVEKVLADVDNKNEVIRPELAADPFRQQPDSRYGRFSINKEVPFFMDEYDEAVEELKTVYQHRRTYLQDLYRDTKVQYKLDARNEHEEILTFSVDGNTPVQLDFSNLQKQGATVVKLHTGSAFGLDISAREILYPGRRVMKGNVVGRGDNWTVTAFGKDRIVPSPEHYRFAIYKPSQTDSMSHIKAVNALTGETVTLTHSDDELADKTETASPHPWLLQDRDPRLKRQVVFSGDIIVDHDLVFEKESEVIILPGTRFSIAAGKSIFIYTRLLAEGSADQPILFKRLDPDQAWGSLVIQGRKTDGSRLGHITVQGGSVASRRLINYPGQINIHDTEDFRLDHCHILENTVGDDSLHVAYSSGTISNCLFENTAFDALDMDIATVSVTDSRFYNLGNDALDLMTSDIRVEQVDVQGAGDKCVSTGEETRLHLTSSKLVNCETGIAVKDQSSAYISNIQFAGHKSHSIALYQKNPRYGFGGTISGDNIQGVTMSDVLVEGNSKYLIGDQAVTTQHPEESHR